ncbi:MAG: DUF1963 domain-containing protein [Bacteroidales bacterium]|nr:DUF1963 domain-containing protein [Bacteroidales bacterium]
MAIGFRLKKTERILFCGSKWWGDPDFPEQMEYPTVKVKDEDGETIDYPLTFICQINCEDISKYDKEGKLPHEGMLYFFGAIDEYLGYETYTHNGIGEWPKGQFIVKYAKNINFETFQSCILVDDEDQPLTEPEMEMEFFECEEDAQGFKLLGIPFFEDVRQNYPEYINLLQLEDEDEIGLRFYDCGSLNVMMKESDLKFGNWKKTKAHLQSL